MSLKRNILANYASQLYITLIGIVMVPLYIRYMGVEAYGLVGFFAMLQAWFVILDMGLAPTLSRETARFRGGAMDALSFLRLMRALELTFIFVALIGAVGIFIAAPYIARDWLQGSTLPSDEIEVAVKMMGAIIAMRWLAGLYRSLITGAERLVWLGGYNILIGTSRFVGVMPLFFFVGVTPTIFFGFQLIVAVVELLGLLIYSYQLLPKVRGAQFNSWDLSPLKPLIKFSLAIAFASSIWIVSTQTDKLILSKLLPLAEYGYFTLAVLVGSAVLLISAPVGSALLPRMAKLESEGDQVGLFRIYHQGTQLVAIFAGATSITLACFAEPLLWVWTGDRGIAQQAAPILILYALGNGVLSVATFPYYLQYAKGDLRLHLVGNIFFVLFLVPSIIWATREYGGVGAGYVWLAMNLVIFLVWLPFVHQRFSNELNVKWYFEDVLAIFVAAGLAGFFFSLLVGDVEGKALQLGVIGICGVVTVFAGALASSWVRANFVTWISATR